MIQTRPSPLFLLALLLTVGPAACASGTGGDGETRPRVDRNVLAQEDIQGSRASDAYELVRERRGQWLRSRGGGDVVRVYFGSSLVGGPETLRGVSLSQVSRIEYMDATTANQRFGPGHAQGAIIVHFSG